MCVYFAAQSFLDGRHIRERCDSAAQLMLKGCEEEFIENPGVKVEVNMTASSSQVTPRDISIQLRAGKEQQEGTILHLYRIIVLHYRIVV